MALRETRELLVTAARRSSNTRHDRSQAYKLDPQFSIRHPFLWICNLIVPLPTGDLAEHDVVFGGEVKQ
ncbi:hypothetical protein MUK42_20763 [Musa troglodytarum]|uniref:Uncharacterized protein n=1 Tax=Musa troglodytarum TaxID=320322 RepID=A0A9E7G8B4_9LILI|nr:hypothetical protein MUK42_20763 [Musa troglodytarum]